MSGVVLVTGASLGMGELSAKTLADADYKVYAGYGLLSTVEDGTDEEIFNQSDLKI